MRILVVSNFYPPHHFGGYELGCHAAVEALRARGHTVVVLTSDYHNGETEPESEAAVFRRLDTDLFWPTRTKVRGGKLLLLFRKELRNQTVFRRLCCVFRPDIVYVWNPYSISLSLVFIARSLGIPVGYYVFDAWLGRWEGDAWHHLFHSAAERMILPRRMRLLQGLARVFRLRLTGDALDLTHAQFCSQFIKDQASALGKPVSDALVIPWGVDGREFAWNDTARPVQKLLYVGRIVPEKGADTAIRALGLLSTQGVSMTLTIAGGAPAPAYEAFLKELTQELGLERHVRFLGDVARDRLRALYRDHDVLVFPSVWEEPFGIARLEGMSSGLALVDTATGAGREICRDGYDALFFPAGDAAACAEQIHRLRHNPALFAALRRNGRRTTEDRFDIGTTISRIESALRAAATDRRALPR